MADGSHGPGLRNGWETGSHASSHVCLLHWAIGSHEVSRRRRMVVSVSDQPFEESTGKENPGDSRERGDIKKGWSEPVVAISFFRSRPALPEVPSATYNHSEA